MKALSGSLLGAVTLVCLVGTTIGETVRVFGSRFRHPQASEEFIRTYVDMPKDHDGSTVPLAVGLQLTPGFIRMSDELPVTWNYTATVPPNLGGVSNPNGDTNVFPGASFEQPRLLFPQVGLNPFPFAGLTYNFFGHPPIGVYDLQHFDVRFFMEDYDWWWSTQYPVADVPKPGTGACPTEGAAKAFYRANMPVPVDCWPGNPMQIQSIGHYMWGVGMHLYNLMEPGWQAFAAGSGVDEVDSFVWGMQDGKIAYMESMFSRTKALTPDINECIDFADQIPKHFDTERWVPTRKCIVAGPATIKLEYSKFVKVSSGCSELRNATDTVLVGYFPQSMLPVYSKGGPCKVPEP